MTKNLLAEAPALPGRLLALLPGTLGGGAPARRRAAPVVRRAPSGPADRLALTEVRGNITITDRTITVWFTLRPQVWPFRSDGVRETAIASAAAQYAGLAGHHLHLRRTTVPFDVRTWARNL